MNRSRGASLVNRKALAWTTLGLLLFSFAPRASADPASDCLLDCDIVGEVPDLEGPVLDDPILEDPDLDDPILEGPALEDPALEDPDLEVPDVDVPDLEVPDLEVPDLEVPDVEVPDLEDPDVELPDLEVPDLEDPDVELPDLDDPEVEVPDLDDADPTGGQVVDRVDEIADPVTKPVEGSLLPVNDPPSDDVGEVAPSGGSDGSGDAGGPDASSPSSDAGTAVTQLPNGLGAPDLDIASDSPTSTDQAVGELIRSVRPSAVARLLEFAAEAATQMAFPLGLGLAVLFFLAIERRIDRRDPKLQMAPVVAEYDRFS